MKYNRLAPLLKKNFQQKVLRELTASFPLFMRGSVVDSQAIHLDLFLHGISDLDASITLFIDGDQFAIKTVDLYLTGKNSSSLTCPLYLHSSQKLLTFDAEINRSEILMDLDIDRGLAFEGYINQVAGESIDIVRSLDGGDLVN